MFFVNKDVSWINILKACPVRESFWFKHECARSYRIANLVDPTKE